MRFTKALLLIGFVLALAPGVAAAEQLTLDPDLGIIGQSHPGGSAGTGPMGHFNLTPKVGYMYLGGQGGYTSASGAGSNFGGRSINALDVMIDLSWGGPGSAYSFAPYYLFQDCGTDILGNKAYMHGVGLYNAYWFTWDVDGGRSGFWYPGLGFGTGTGFSFGGDTDWGVQIWLHMPVGFTWYPSKSTKVGISLETSIGFQMTMFSSSSNYFISYGVQTDVLLGIKFF